MHGPRNTGLVARAIELNVGRRPRGAILARAKSDAIVRGIRPEQAPRLRKTMQPIDRRAAGVQSFAHSRQMIGATVRIEIAAGDPPIATRGNGCRIERMRPDGRAGFAASDERVAVYLEPGNGLRRS